MLAALAVGVALGGCHRDIRLLPGGAAGASGSAGAAGGANPAGTAGHAGAAGRIAGAAGAAGAGAAGGAGASGHGGGAADASAAGDAGPTCNGPGDPILLPTASGRVCAAALATRGHRFSLCACNLMTVPQKIRTDGFDSTTGGGPQENDTSAAVGVDGLLQTAAELRAGGAIYVAGGVIASDHLQSGASLRVGASLSMLDSNADVGGDAFVVGDVSGSVRVTGTLHVPSTSTVATDVQAASVVREAVAVAAPCDCTVGFVDAAGAIAGVVTAAAGGGTAIATTLPRGSLAGVTTATRVELACGEYLLDQIDAQAAVTLAVHGRVLLAVTGDVVVRGGLAVALDAGAELDLLIGGRLSASGAGALVGTTSAPARFRIWVAGTSSISLDDGLTVGAVLHAPGAVVTASSGLTLYGSLLGGSLALWGESAVHYDRAILSAGTGCGEPAATPVP